MKKAAKTPSAKKQTTQAPVIAKGNEKDVFAKLVKAATDYDAAWSMVRKTFSRKQFGKVREIVQKFSEYKTLRAAYDASHGKGAKTVAKKSAAKKPVAKEAIRQAQAA